MALRRAAAADHAEIPIGMGDSVGVPPLAAKIRKLIEGAATQQAGAGELAAFFFVGEHVRGNLALRFAVCSFHNPAILIFCARLTC